MCIGEKIKAFRVQKGMTQTELANAICVTSQAVSKWENGKTLPDIENLLRIAEFFCVH